jgi:hypothetical protein
MIMNIFTSHTNSDVLSTCCKVFDFLSGASDDSATRPTIIHEDTMERLTAMSATILNETFDILTEIEAEIDATEIQEFEKDFCDNLRFALIRFNHLSQIVIPEASDDAEDDSRSVFSIMNRIVEAMLGILTYTSANAAFYKIEWIDIDVLGYVRLSAEAVLENALDCILHDNEMELVRAKTQESIESVKVNSDMLIKICEGIVVGKQEGGGFDEDVDDMVEDEEDEKTIEFSLPLQLAALACLVDLYAARNCDESVKNREVLNLGLSNDIPKRVSVILTQLVDIVGFPAVSSKHDVGLERLQKLHFKTIDIVMGVYTLMNIGLLRTDIASLWYACYGGVSDQSVKLLGGTWDSVVDVYERESMVTVVACLEEDAGFDSFKAISKLWRLGMEQVCFPFIYLFLGYVSILFRQISRCRSRKQPSSLDYPSNKTAFAYQ